MDTGVPNPVNALYVSLNPLHMPTFRRAVTLPATMGPDVVAEQKPGKNELYLLVNTCSELSFSCQTIVHLVTTTV